MKRDSKPSPSRGLARCICQFGLVPWTSAWISNTLGLMRGLFYILSGRTLNQSFILKCLLEERHTNFILGCLEGGYHEISYNHVISSYPIHRILSKMKGVIYANLCHPFICWTGCHISRMAALSPPVANAPALQVPFHAYQGSRGTDNRSIRCSVAPWGLHKRQTTPEGCLALAHPCSRGSERRSQGTRSRPASDRAGCFSVREREENREENQNRWQRDSCCWHPREAGSYVL